MNIHEYFRERVDLAETYARDGGFFGAARTLRELADHLEEHSKATMPRDGVIEERKRT